MARAGKFAEAEALLRERVKFSGSTDWLGLGAMVLAQRDETRFKAVCQEIMTHLKKVDPPTAARIALLSPDPGIASAGINTLMEKVRAQKPHPGDSYFIMIEGFDDYRPGRHETAIEVLTPLANGNAFPGWSAAAAAVVSMSYHKLGKIEDSKLTHTPARTVTAANWPRRATRGTWQEWLMAHLLLQEAGKVMAAPLNPPPAK